MISVTILTKDSGKTLLSTFTSLPSSWEVVLVDTGSKDDTLEIARRFPQANIFTHPFTSFGALRNWAAEKASYDWILALDSDESLSPSLVEEIKKMSLEDSCVYSFPFHNYFRGKWMKCCGWYPESHIRLYSRKKTHFIHEKIHEGIAVKGLKIISLQHPVIHTPYLNMEDFLRKMQLYTSLFAEQYRYKKSSSFTKALFHGSFAFFKSYLWKRGIFFGSRGFIVSSYQASCAFYKYLKLAEENQK